jgi:hypothetical protein
VRDAENRRAAGEHGRGQHGGERESVAASVHAIASWFRVTSRFYAAVAKERDNAHLWIGTQMGKVR